MFPELAEAFAPLAYSPPGRGSLLLGGLLATIGIALGAYAVGLTLGLLGALGKLHGVAPLRWFLEGYTTVVRAVPELVLILLIFYAGTAAINALLVSIGYRPIDLNPVFTGIMVIGFVMGAYATEVIRGAIRTVPKGEVEASKAYGFSSWQTLTRVTLPAMLPLAIPGLANLWLIVIKDTALLAVIGSIELATVTKQSAASTRLYLTFYLAAFFIYLGLALASMYGIRQLENYFRRGQKSVAQGA